MARRLPFPVTRMALIASSPFTMNRCFERIQISPVNLGVDRTEEVATVPPAAADKLGELGFRYKYCTAASTAR
ncbi:hypothetical protein ABZP36_021875 [Zizania latifolia]